MTSATASSTVESIVARLERLPFTRTHWGIASLLGTGTFFDAFDSASIGIVLAVIPALFKINLGTAGLLISGGYLGQFVGAIAFGFCAERYGRKPAFVGTLLVFGIFSALAALATTFNELLLWRILQGIGLGAEVPVAGALLNELLRGRTRGRVVMFYESVFTWGLLAAPLVGTALSVSLPRDSVWRAILWIGALPVVAALIAWRMLPESPRWLAAHDRFAEADLIVARLERDAAIGGELPAPIAAPQVERRPTSFGEMFSPRYARRTILTWTQWFTTYFATYGYSVFLPLLYVRVGGLPPSKAIALTIIPAIGQVIVAYAVALSIDHVGRKPWFVGGYALAFVSMLVGIVLVGLGHHGWQVLFGVGLFAALGTGVNAIGVYVYTPELFPTRMRALATSTGSAANRIASTIAPLCVGGLLAAGFGLGSVFALFAVVLLIGLVVMIALGIETRNRILEELSP
jgi:putative MFS transporter